MKTDTTSARSSRHAASLQGFITLALALAILLMVNYLGFKYYLHKDLSQSQFYTLSPKTVDVLKNLDAPVTITTLLTDKYKQQIDDLLKEYQRIGGKNILIERIDPAYDIARAAALQKRLQFDGTESLVILEYNGKSHFVKQADLYEVNPMSGQIGAFKGEQQITSAMVSLIEGKPSKVYFTAGHGEHPIDNRDTAQGYGAVQQSLKNENIETGILNLAAKGDVPNDADAVVIAGPSISFAPIEVAALEKYVENNGKLVVLLDPYITLGLDDLLKKYGMAYDNDLVLYRGMTTTGAQITVPMAQIYQGGFSPHPITTKLAQANLQLILTGARSITLLKDDKGQPNPKVQFLLQTDPDSWGWINKTPTATGDMLQFKDRTFDKTADIAGPLTIAAAYDGGTMTDPNSKATVPATRIIAVGSSKFLENDAAEPVGMNFFINSVDWLVKKDAVLDILPKKPQEYGVSLLPVSARTLGWASLIFIPGAALLLGFFTWFSRRK